MGISTRSSCNGCETCRNCGRGSYHVYLCDRCNEEEDELYNYDGDWLCERCTKLRMIEDTDIIDDFFNEIVIRYGIDRRSSYEIE